MKITIDNIEEFKPYLGKSKAADAGFDFIVENGDLYNDDDTIKATIDKSLQLINKIVSENAPQKKTLKHKYTKGKGGKRKVTGRRKKGEKKTEEKPKRKRKTTDKKNKEKKPSKPKVGEEAQWQNALRTFARMCGKEKTVNTVRKFVLTIQSNFAKKLGKKTPHIELIREIQTKLLPYANKTEQTKVQLPEWSDFKAKCQTTAKEWTVSKTIKKADMTEKTLSGLKKKCKRKKKMCK
ncbi:MAG: hypothetical protein IJ150_14360 [Bacteroidales bacterium]|nr:hypothetical protein [Bacteroidales bacterium]